LSQAYSAFAVLYTALAYIHYSQGNHDKASLLIGFSILAVVLSVVTKRKKQT